MSNELRPMPKTIGAMPDRRLSLAERAARSRYKRTQQLGQRVEHLVVELARRLNREDELVDREREMARIRNEITGLRSGRDVRKSRD